MARDGEGDARQVYDSGIHAIRQGDEKGNGQCIGRVEDPGNPACLAVAQVPLSDELRQEGRPRVRSDLGADLRRAHAGDEAGRRQSGQECAGGLRALQPGREPLLNLAADAAEHR